MKKARVIATITALFFVAGMAGCASLPNLGNDALSLFAIKQAARELGYWIGRSKTDADDAIVQAVYQSIRNGGYHEVEVTEALLKLKFMNPRLFQTCLDALGLMGAILGPNSEVVDLSVIPEAAWNAAETGYKQGLMIGKAEREAKEGKK